MDKKMEKFKFEVWVHPKEGGDDYLCELEVKASNLKDAKKVIEKWLDKRSDVLDDYKVIIDDKKLREV